MLKLIGELPGNTRDFAIDVACDGTDFQCRRPIEALPCAEGTEYIVGGGPVGTTTWDRCNYVLLENTVVEPEAILTINPGVTVKGNYLDDGNPGGSVHFEVQGTLQAVGTEDAPVAVLFNADGLYVTGLVPFHKTIGGRTCTVVNLYDYFNTRAEVRYNDSSSPITTGTGSISPASWTWNSIS